MQSWGRRLVVSISDSGWSLVVVLLAVAFFGWLGIGVDGMRAVGEGPRGATKNGNCNTLLSTKGHEGPRRTATAEPFCPRRAAKGHEGPRRTATATPFCPRRAAKDHEERQLQHPFVREGPRRTTKNGNCNTFFPRRAATNTFNPLIHVGIQRAAKYASLICWGVALYVGTGIAVRDVRGG